MIQVYAVKDRKEALSDAAILEKIETLNQAVARLQERVEDLEDLRDLEAAITENAGKPLIPWEQVKAELELD
jgi:predicted AAA+ superfamily ATPase